MPPTNSSARQGRVAQDGALPFQVVLRRLGRSWGLLWKKEEQTNRQYLFMPDALYVTPCLPTAHPPDHVERGSHAADLLVARTMRVVALGELTPAFCCNSDGIPARRGPPLRAAEHQRRGER
eukprot:9966899-Alexandrium_andersonii.AAC.1